MATQEKETTAVALAPEQQNEIESIRQQGAYAVTRAKELQIIAVRLQGLKWGDVRGADLSPAARHAIAEFCYVTRANDMIHIDILGGKPYLNARYWKDLVTQHPHHISDEQLNISAGVCKELRAKANEARSASERAAKDAERLGGDPDLVQMSRDLLIESYGLERRAREFELKRAHYGAPDDEKSEVYETIIKRYAPWVPLEDIQNGTIKGDNPIQTIHECNWAGARNKDPVGTEHPGLTARTRSFRRAAERAYSAFLKNRAHEIERAEQIVEAEWEEVQADYRRSGNGGSRLIASGKGEPIAVPYTEDRFVDQAPQTPPPAAPPPAAPNGGGAPAEVSADELGRLNRAYFASLRDAGVNPTTERKDWQVRNGFPASSTQWTAADYTRAIEILEAPFRARCQEGAKLLGFNSIGELCEAWKVPTPTTVKALRELQDSISAHIDGAEQKGLEL